MYFVFLIIGFVFLIKGADLLVDSSSKLAAIYKLSPFIIGISIVALGTSAPEGVIGILSGIKQSNDIILGTVLGSSIANIALVVGLTALVFPIKVKESIYKRDIPLSIASQMLLFLLVSIGGIISRFDSLILLTLFVFFIFYIASESKKKNNISTPPIDVLKNDKVTSENSSKKKLKLLFLVLIGMAGLIVGGNMVVENGKEIALVFGLSETFIGLSIVALGTSLPELVTSIVGSLKKEPDIVLGNIIGSNIFNILFVLGLSSLVYPIEASPEIRIDMIIIILASILLLLFSFTQKTITRKEGFSFFLLYISYIVFAYFSGNVT
ncbi:calcium/sodium antiporter [Herbivorax sp. ANBcel31]|uniref:calcium/sodium antiporter n=1 Tax=Herbivorax sp. ANBcel31 TaxID=3069754 RepID=UPI0027B4DDC0|nr:calcium/sodium antiporter [Herbivorax sp. ANBcel31]MDQ2084818.1 calcium/sodium antiporter [Herbivorax sp. ANBcel31]